MSISTEEVSKNEHLWYIFSSIGAIVGATTCFLILLHMTYHWYKQYKFNNDIQQRSSRRKMSARLLAHKHDKYVEPRKNEKSSSYANVKRSLYPYYIMIVYLICGILKCSINCMVLSNIIMHYKMENYTAEQCAIGYFGYHALVPICKALMFNLFNYRIQIIFADTPYKFNYKIYLIMYIIPWYRVSFCIICLFIAQFVQSSQLEWMLNVSSDDGSSYLLSYIIFCSAKHFPNAIAINHINELSIEFIMSVGLLFMFISSLYQIYKSLLQHHIKEYITIPIAEDTGTLSESHVELSEILRKREEKYKQKKKNVSSSGSSGRNKSISSSEKNKSLSPSDRNFSLKRLVEETPSYGKTSIVRLMILQNLMRKQTILICTALIPSITYRLIAIKYPSMGLQSGWDITIDAICTCLMFGCSISIWNFLSKYLCCNMFVFKITNQ